MSKMENWGKSQFMKIVSDMLGDALLYTAKLIIIITMTS